MIEGLLSLLLSYMVKISCTPYFNAFETALLTQGHSIESVEKSLQMFEMCIQAIAFFIVFGIIHLIKYLINKV